MAETAYRLCERCRTTQYCSEVCQMEDWQFHKKLICDLFCEIVAKLALDGYTHIGPYEDSEALEASNPRVSVNPHIPKYIQYHKFRNMDGDIILMRINVTADIRLTTNPVMAQSPSTAAAAA